MTVGTAQYWVPFPLTWSEFAVPALELSSSRSARPGCQTRSPWCQQRGQPGDG
jgi:hypothetical protein